MAKGSELVVPSFGPGGNEQLLEEATASPHAADLSVESSDVPLQNKKKRAHGRWLKKLLVGKPPPVPTSRLPSKERNSNPFSQGTFWWINRLMAVGYKRTLELEDIPLLPPTRRNGGNTERLALEFRKQRANGSKYPLLMAIHRVFWKEWWFGGISQFVATMLLTLTPLMLKYLIVYATDNYYGESVSIGTGVGLAIGVVVMSMVASIGINQFIYRSLIVGGMTRASLISMIYAKSQVISARAKSGGSGVLQTHSTESEEKLKKNNGTNVDEIGWTNGRVQNLMSTDTYRIDQAISWLHILWTTPLQIIVALVQLVVNIGPSGVAGFAVLIITVPFMTYVTRILTKRRGQANKITDERISLTQELLQNVRFVKYFSWEESFLEKLATLRAQEISFVQILLGARSVITAIAMCLPVFAAIIAFLTYSLTHPGFGAANVFSSLALFNGLRMPLNMLPMVIGMAIDAWVSLGRIESYFLAEDEAEKREVDSSLKHAIVLQNASFTWETVAKPKEGVENKETSRVKVSKSTETETQTAKAKLSGDSSTVNEAIPFHMDQLNLAITRNELIAVVGGVGSGKTSLLAAIAGEMRMTSGFVGQGANMAYCPQYAWIQNATVRDNITFGRDFDAKWYDQVVEACALKPDFKMFTAGDQTEVGERGITLSGGQKQRLSIARAIYFSADIVVLDDPLSAVDAGVGKQIFDQAICGVMNGKCRILATHQLQVLSRCDRIVWMIDGKIDAVDTYDNLLRTNERFAEMLSMTASMGKVKTATTKDDNDSDSESESTELEKLARVNTKASQREPLTGTLMQLEDKAKDSIKWKVYVDYLKASGSVWNAPLITILVCFAQTSNIVGTVWLGYWTSDKYSMSTGAYIGVYVALGVAQAVFLCSYSLLLTIVGTNASKVLLQKAMTRTLHAPMWFFDTTPLGRIMNRFSKDVDVMDNFLTEALRLFSLTLAQVVSIFVLIIVYFPWFAVALVPMMGVLYFATGYYRASGRELKRHEAVLRSTVFSVFGEALSGTAPIRAYGVQALYSKKISEHLDTMNSAYFLTFAAQCWLSVRLDLIGNVLALVTALLVVTDRFNVNPSLAAVVLTYVLQAVGLIQFAIRQLAETENSMNSTERVAFYANSLPSELDSASKTVHEPAESWPTTGDIRFIDVQMRYRPGLPLVLKGLNVSIGGGERIGVVGRTGAGKSSIMSCLFRLVELSHGHIDIDGVDIASVSLHDLRSRISIIPQDPTLFRGTVRSNLDPMNEHTDLDLWNALRQANLIGDDELNHHITNEKAQNQMDITENPVEQSSAVAQIKLDTPVVEEGHNFSLGQRQLMALARALLRGSRIIVCDEATSSVDEETDRKIQRTMQIGFKGKTLLCIAHRLRTIINYDRVLVMDQGKIAECAAPFELWKDEASIFRSVCDKSKIRAEDFDMFQQT